MCYLILRSICTSFNLLLTFSSTLPPLCFILAVGEGGLFILLQFWAIFIFNCRPGSRDLSGTFVFPGYVNASVPAALVGPSFPSGLLMQQMHCQSSYCTDIDPTSP